MYQMLKNKLKKIFKNDKKTIHVANPVYKKPIDLRTVKHNYLYIPF